MNSSQPGTLHFSGWAWNNAHASLEGVDYTLPGWAELPEEFTETWEASGPFVEITADEDGNITGMTPAEEILPEEPEPEPELGVEYATYDELAEAIREGVNAV